MPFMVLALLALSLSVFAQASRTERPVIPVRETAITNSDERMPLDSRIETPESESGIAPARAFDGGGFPDEPGHAMDTESQDIYIFVTLQTPPGPDPPDSVVITSENCTSPTEDVKFKMGATPDYYGGDYYHAYRDTVALFYITQCLGDTLAPNYNLLRENTVSRYYTDNFVDTLWTHYWNSSKGVCDTLVNLFYVFTTVDTGMTAPGGFAESPYPSWCVCEYDQPMYEHPSLGKKNVVSIPNIHNDYALCSNFEGMGAIKVDEWDPFVQQWVQRGFKMMPGLWIPDGSILVSHIYQIHFDVTPPSMFTTFEPGIVPSTDTTYTIDFVAARGGRNVIMLPFLVSHIMGIHDCSDLESSIEDAGSAVGADMYKVEFWDAALQSWVQIGYEMMPGLWVPDGHLRPGMPYRIFVRDASASFTWPM